MRFRLPRLALSAALCYAPYAFIASAAIRPFPEDIAVQAYVKPAGDKLELLVRVPMAVFNDVQFPWREPGYLDFPATNTTLPGLARYRIADSIDVFEDGAILPKPRVISTRVAVLSDSSFATYDEALAHVKGPPLDVSINTLPGQSWLDILFEYPIHSEHANFSVRTRFAHLAVSVSTTLKFIPPGTDSSSPSRTFTYTGDPGRVILEPRLPEDVIQFLRWGFGSLLNGTDYLLLIFCMVLPFRRAREIVPVAVAFASAIPITLIASASGLAPDGLWFGPLIDTCVAILVLYTALANIAGGITPGRRAIAALIFGLISGFSFSFGFAAKAQFAGTYPLWSAIAFTVGVEAALLLVVAVLVPVLGLLFRYSSAKRIEAIVLSVLAAHVAWHWMTERWDRLDRFPFNWPVFDAALLAVAMRWMMILVIFGGAVWFIAGALNSRKERGHEI
ncbi:MAG TPA: HupE/UreJ family protein [Bryobacteraceae bacterium]|jgi:hypothetical protein|nr:HupE/UreJ family protein [Bryobacteraceae bacterium]